MYYNYPYFCLKVLNSVIFMMKHLQLPFLIIKQTQTFFLSFIPVARLLISHLCNRAVQINEFFIYTSILIKLQITVFSK